MAPIPFIQYMRPNGRMQEVSIDRPDNIVLMAERIISLGFRFECEELSTGHVSLSISDDLDDYAIVVLANGPGIPNAVDKLIEEFDVGLATKHRNTIKSN